MALCTDAGAVTKPALASLQAIITEVKQCLSLFNTQANINICNTLNAKHHITGKRLNSNISGGYRKGRKHVFVET